MATTTMPKILAREAGKGTDLKRRKGSEPRRSARDYTYTTTEDCGDGTSTRSVYILRGDTGTYHEDFCGGVFSGTLEFVEDVGLDLDGLVIRGHVYNGTDESGTYGYLFSAEEVAEIGSHVVLAGGPHEAGQGYVPEAGWLATRTSP